MTNTSECRPWMGLLLLGLGVGLTLATVIMPGWVPPDKKWPVWVIVGLFVVTGSHIVLATTVKSEGVSRISGWTAALLYTGFASLGFWVALNPHLTLQGGIPGLPPAWNRLMGRLLFGLGGLLTAGSAIYFVVRSCRKT